MTRVYQFTIVASVEASSPLKVLSFIQRTLVTMSFIQLKQWTEFIMNDIVHTLSFDMSLNSIWKFSKKNSRKILKKNMYNKPKIRSFLDD